MNYSVKVKLNDFGRQVVMDHYAFLKELPGYGPDYVPSCLTPNEEGFQEFQLWILFEIFGPHLHLGIPEVPFEKNEIIFDFKDEEQMKNARGNERLGKH
ncbi:hypothetical protein [Paenibacillus alkalitolerans]|uniref:hypothetical protein n=1 Tax=Paenibacillus alkalitolerans TaxID=2799335 RepID=UPI0018F58106|nr:hypothetical protein [Paenibacillus alkalitolerans]